jgi:hypothetical protein
MDYMDCANMLYKVAQNSSTVMMVPPNENKNPDYAKGGAGLGAAMGVASAFGKGMGPKKELNPNFVKGTPKSHTEYDVLGKKTRKVKFGKRMGTLGNAITNTPGKFGGSLLKRTALGAGVGLAGGALFNGMMDAAPQDKLASALWDFVASDEDIENLRQGEIEQILNESRERQENSFLDDIDCEVCDYKGKPTNKGLCPKCGAVLGKKEEYIPAVKPYVPYDGYPMNGVTVYEQATIDDLETQAGEEMSLPEKYAMARAWKTNFSEGIRNTLENHGLLNYEKEMAGLNLGTANIAKKIGVPITQMNSKELATRSARGTMEHPLGNRLMQGAKESDLRSALKNIIHGSGDYYSFTLGNNKIINRGKNPMSVFKQFPIPAIEEATGKMSNFDKKYLDAVFTRHEADEVRGAMNAVKKGRKISYNGADAPVTQLRTMHQTPTVTFRESANIATAPPNVKNLMKETRSVTGDEFILNEIFKHPYGVSGKVDVSGMNKAEKYVAKENKPFYNELLEG